MQSIKKIAHEMYEELFDHGNEKVLDKYVDPEFVYQNPMRPVKGRQQVIDLVQAQRDAFKDYRLSIDHIVADDECAAVAWTISGIHENDFLGFPPSGKEIKFSGVTIHRFENGRSVEAWSHSNMHEVFRS